jgi:hypothetical protein
LWGSQIFIFIFVLADLFPKFQSCRRQKMIAKLQNCLPLLTASPDWQFCQLQLGTTFFLSEAATLQSTVV